MLQRLRSWAKGRVTTLHNDGGKMMENHLRWFTYITNRIEEHMTSKVVAILLVLAYPQEHKNAMHNS